MLDCTWPYTAVKLTIERRYALLGQHKNYCLGWVHHPLRLAAGVASPPIPQAVRRTSRSHTESARASAGAAV